MLENPLLKLSNVKDVIDHRSQNAYRGCNDFNFFFRVLIEIGIKGDTSDICLHGVKRSAELMDNCRQKEVDVLVSGLYFFLDLDLGVVDKKSDECFLINPQQFLGINLEKF